MRTSKLCGSLLLAVSSLMVASAAQAQESCPDGRVCVSGNKFKPYDPWALDPSGGAGGGDYGGGSTDIGGGSGSGAGQAPVAPPAKTPEQKAAERAKCESDRSDSLGRLERSYDQNMAVCVQQSGHVFGYFHEQLKEFFYDLGLGSGSCATKLTNAFNFLSTQHDKRRDACVEIANKG